MSKKIFYFMVLVLIIASCGNRNSELLNPKIVNNPASANGASNNDPQPAFKFEQTEHDFGKVVEGEIVTYSFRFTNSGGSDLIITQAKGSCGCTVPRYPTNPVKAGETAQIEVSFDSAKRLGFQHKTITVIANTIPSTVVLSIKANVVKI